MAERVNLDEQERRNRTAEFLRGERERYEYLLLCAEDTEHEELAWETIVAKMTVEDFVRAANEVLAAREVVEQARLQYRPHAYLRAALDAYDRRDPPATHQPGGGRDG
jgi:hypothetical protein